MKAQSKEELNSLEVQYGDLLSKATRLMDGLRYQIQHLVEAKSIVLGVPIEARVKSWSSILSKLQRGALTIRTITEVSDLIGIRLILLFRRDVETTCKHLAATFQVVEKEDKQERLGTNQFGYASVHYRVKLPDGWNSLPSFADTGIFHAEIQVRTLAQHIWAASSHVLQYKNEESVPKSVLRSINRVAALLETADLEFERALELRAQYLSQAAQQKIDGALNVDLLARILDEELPPQNKDDQEQYAELFSELHFAGIRTGNQLRSLIAKRKPEALREDEENVIDRKETNSSAGTTEERTEKGVYFTHVGLTRVMLTAEFGKDFLKKALDAEMEALL